MSKKLLWSIAFFMALAMLGLILVQTYWILNAYRLKERQFSQSVNRAMQNIAIDLQEREAMWHIMNEVKDHDSSWTGAKDVFSYRFEGFRAERQLNMKMNKGVSRGQVFQENVHIYEHTNPGDGTTEITIVGSDTIFQLGNYPELLEDTGQIQRITMIQPDQLKNRVQQSIEENRIILERIMERMIAPSEPLERRIRPETLNRLIEKHLSQSGIHLDYEYAVLHENRDIVFQTENYKTEGESEYFIASLFPQDLFTGTGYLALYFPRQASFLLRSLGFMGISSMILTLFIILSVFITVYIIFRQKKLSEMKNDFVSNMTHELKTPISTISLASQMLNDNSIPDQSKNLGHIAGIISDESKRLGYQVEKVLQMAMFERSRIKLKKKMTDINELVHQVITSFTLQVRKKNGEVTESYEAGNSLAEVDPVHFTNMISNLMDNALKYSREHPRVGIATYNQNGMICIQVTDNGVGIRKEDQKRIFEKFYRVPTGNIHNVKGFGLGLSYVKKIAEAHHGSVSLKSEISKGTEFIISLPANSV